MWGMVFTVQPFLYTQNGQGSNYAGKPLPLQVSYWMHISYNSLT